MVSRLPLILLVLAVAPRPAAAQELLTLDQAVAATLANNPDLEAARAGEREGVARAAEARAGYMPRLDLTEAWQRGDQPVFVFSSLLSQRRFTFANFAIDTLNNPDAVTNHRAALVLEQPLFDAGRLTAIRATRLGARMAREATRELAGELALQVTRAYGDVLLAAAGRRAADSAVEAAREDLARAERRRDVGMVTEADVLSLQVHLAQVRERQIRAASADAIARAALNRLMGTPLDRPVSVEEPALSGIESPAAQESEDRALRDRGAVRQAELAVQQADIARMGARTAFLPQLSLHGSYEWNGHRFGQREASWTVSAQARWNLFGGLGNLARLRAAEAGRERAAAQRASAEAGVRLEVRTAQAQLQAALARESVGRTTVLQARESQRIIRDRYESGLAGVNDVLRAANAVLDAEALRIAAVVDVIVGRAAVSKASGEAAAGQL